MRLIAHRGNIFGRCPEKENKPEYVLTCLSLGYDCEIDVWKIDNEIFLGHDKPQYRVSEKFLKKEGLWCHAKNLSALEKMIKMGVNCFWHETDMYTLTSKGYIWAYPGTQTNEKTIIVDLNLSRDYQKIKIFGVCSDYVSNLSGETKNE